MTRSTSGMVLDPAARDVVRMTAEPPFLYQLGPERGRARLVELQSTGMARPEADIEDIRVPGGPTGQVPVRIVRPKSPDGRLGDRMRSLAGDVVRPKGTARRPLPAVVFVHGAGWVFGDATTHDRLIRELAVRSGAAVVFPEYSRSPEARFPTALEQCWTVANWIAEQGGAFGLDGSRMAVAGDSVGGNMATVLTMMAKERGGPRFAGQVLFYPVTDADFETGSYRQFAEGFYLGRAGMIWYWDQYLPDPVRREDPMAAPLRADLDQLKGLPPALIVTGEADVLRDEGEAYAARLRRAGVPTTGVRYQGMIHDFVMLDALAGSGAARAAVAQAAQALRDVLHD